LYNENNARANAAATALASGISAEDGGDTIQSNGAITVHAIAFSDSFAQGSDVIGGSGNDITSAVTEDSDSGSITFIDESLDEGPEDVVGKFVRFLTGNNEDFIAQVTGFDPGTGTIVLAAPLPEDLKAAEVDDEGNIITPADEYTLANGRDGESGAFANAFATGIDFNHGLDNGDTMVKIEESLHVKAVAEASSIANAFYNGVANASAAVAADALGIVTGDGNDTVGNYDAITVTAETLLTREVLFPVTGTQSATAMGIGTGAGVDTVLNEGEISVTAIAESVRATVEATGISMGDGDDILLNAGTGSIAASTVIADITAPATAVSAGAGQDQVSLQGQSSITGHIYLGLDDDLLTLADDATAVGEVKGGAGTDTLRIEDRGMFTLTAPVEMERLEINQGVLEFNGDYLFPADGFMQAEIYNPDTGDLGHGQLVINGEATLDGTAAVIALPRIYTDGESLPLLSAESIRIEAGIPTRFAAVSLPPDSALVDFGYDYRFDVAGRDLFEVTTTVDPFRTVARNSLQRAVANYLERIAPSASGDLAEVIGTFQLLPQDANFDTAFSSLSPDTHDNYTLATFFGVSQYQETLSRRLRARRVDSVSGGTSSRQAGFETDRSLLLAYSGDDSDIRSFYAGEVTEVPAWWRDVWVTAFGQWGDQDGEDGYTGFDYDVLGLSIGIDHPVSDRLLLGASAAYTDTDVDQEKGRGDGDIEGWMASLYSSYSLDKVYIDGMLSYGKNDYDARREVRIGTIKRTARSDHDGDVFAATLGSGYLVTRDDSILEPFGRLQYIKLDEDAFTEKGAGDINQRISSRDTESLTSEIGVRVSRSFPQAGGRLTTDASVAWLHDFDIDDRAITTSYTGAPASSFSVPGQDVERNGVTLGLGVGFETRKGVSSSLNYNGEFRDGFSAHGIIGRISFRF
jgi:outer membrane autotransporter protein